MKDRNFAESGPLLVVYRSRAVVIVQYSRSTAMIVVVFLVLASLSFTICVTILIMIIIHSYLHHHKTGGRDITKKLGEFSANYGEEGVFEMNVVGWLQCLGSNSAFRSAQRQVQGSGPVFRLEFFFDAGFIR